MVQIQSEIVHYPTLKTVLAIEEVIRKANIPLSRNKILAKLPTKVMRSTLNLALEYMEKRRMVLETRKGYIWTYTPREEMERLEEKRLETVSEVKSKILPVLKEHGVVRASIFGSLARGEAKKDSDVDILVEFRKTPSLFSLGGLYADLKGALGRKPDIVTYSSIDDRMKANIMREKVDIL